MLLKEELVLVKKVKKGDQEALGLLWDDITPKLYGYLAKTLNNSSLAEDILQDSWLKAIKAIHTFQPRGVRFRAWVFAIAKNECRSHWRKQKHDISIEDLHAEPKDNTSEIHEKISDKMEVDAVLNKLEEKERTILELRYIGELTFSEIAQILDISVVNARVRTHRAIAKANTLSKQ